MSRRDEYRRYLKSPEWAKNRTVALTRTSGFCQFCGDFAAQVHHVSYPKRFGEEHPNSLIPVCSRCHELSHGIQEMKPLTNAETMRDTSAIGHTFNYLLSGGRVYASVESWAKALQVPKQMRGWFDAGLPRTALLKQDQFGGGLEMQYVNTPVYRWHVVAELLRTFDREFHKHGFKNGRGRNEQYEIELFHRNYDRLVNWGYDLQERAINNAINSKTDPTANVNQETLIEALKQVVAPRLRDHDDKLHEHDVVIDEIKEAVPALRDQTQFISVKQACSELGYEASDMPLHPHSKETRSGLAGRMLTERGAEKGPSVLARLDGQSITAEMNTYRRGAIYAVLIEIDRKQQPGLFLPLRN